MSKPDLRNVPRIQRDEIHIRAVEAVVKNGETVPDVAKELGVSPQSVNGWLRKYREGGKKALVSGKAKGSPRALTPQEEVELIKAIHKQRPDDLKLTGQLWTREHCAAAAKKLFHKKVSLSAMGRLLRRRNMSCQNRLAMALDQNTAPMKDWKRTVFQKIAKEAKSRNASIFFIDKTDVREDTKGRTTLGKKEETLVFEKTEKVLRLNLIGASSRRNDFFFMIYKNGLNAKNLIEFLNRLMHKRQSPVYLVVDSHRAYKSLVVQRYLESLEGKLTLVFFPAPMH